MKPKSSPRISVVIPSFNAEEILAVAIQSVLNQTWTELEIIVVDDGSTDGSPEAIRDAFPDVILLETGQNLGYAGGNNVGIRHALANGAEWVFLLNNDTVVDPAVVHALVDVGQRYPDAGALGAMIYLYGTANTVWYAGASWRPDRAGFIHIGKGQNDGEDRFGEITDTDYTCGCAMLVRADAVRRMGLFDPRFFLCYEESDWCYRARRLGYRCLVVPEAKVWHKVSASFGGHWSPLYAYFWSRNRLLWIEKNLSVTERLAAYRVIARGVWKNIRRLFRNQPATKLTSAAELLGLIDYLLRRFGTSPRWIRRQTAEIRRTTDENMESFATNIRTGC